MTMIKKVCIIGAGTMGSGIAQRCAQSGFKVSMMDTTSELVNNGFSKIKKTLEDGKKRGKVTDELEKKILGNIEGTTDLKEGVKGAQLVIEAVFEEFDIKKKLFEQISELASKGTIIATNTSSLSVTELSKFVKEPALFGGLHFFNPAAFNKLVEVVAGAKTALETIQTLMELSRLLEKFPIRVKDSPGFAVNRFFVPFLNEACRMIDENFANIATIEAAAKETLGIGMGPFELMNFTGIPIGLHAQETLYKGLGEFYRPAESLKRQFELFTKEKQLWKIEGTPVSADMTKVRDRFLGLLFLITCQLVDEGVATKEDTDRGAVTGLRWRAGPFTMMNEYGIGDSYKLVEKFCSHYQWQISIPKMLQKQYESNEPFYLKSVKVYKEGKIANVIIDRPEALNALSPKVIKDLFVTFHELLKDKEIGIVVLTGEGSAFIAGADIKEMVDMTPLAAREFTGLGQRLTRFIETYPIPVIACVNGYALGGGCEFMLACDMVIASKNARIGLPEVTLGIHPGFGGTQRLPRLVGKFKGMELLLTGDQITADEAERIGLINKAVEPERLYEEVRTLANKILSRGPIAIRLAKSAAAKGLDADMDTALALEKESVSLLFSTHDLHEGMKAFIEKRKPDFKNK